LTKIAVLADFLEENWPSMDLAAEELAAHLCKIPNVEGLLVRPPLRAVRAQRPTGLQRAVGRFVQLPIELAARRLDADFYHVADHSYAHLALLFPRDRVGVYCHDIDAFRALLPSSGASRQRVLLSQLLLKGLRRARVVFYSTQAVRDEIVKHGLLPTAQLVHAPYGVAAEFLDHQWTQAAGRRYLLHVGSCIPRKNVDFLLRVFAAVRRDEPEMELVQVGGSWTAAQRDYLETQRLGPYVVQRRGISRKELASLYTHASAVLVPSLSEGFGLPVIEALACGACVVASDIPVLREVGFQGVRFCAPTAEEDWSRAVHEVLQKGEGVAEATRDEVRARYTWMAHATVIRNAYVGSASWRN